MDRRPQGHVTDRSPFDRAARRPRPRLRPDVVAAVFAGGCAGGAVRYAATSAAPAGVGDFPWATLTVNLAGAFILAVVVVVAADVAPSRYLRPLLGTGFCGALTTFSSVVVAADRMLAHGHAVTAGAYLLATLMGGLAATAVGLVLTRAITTNRRLAADGRSRP